MRLISKSTAVALIAAMAALAPVVARAQADQEAVKKNLLAAQGSLAELIKLPAAAALQGDVRTSVSGFIAEFNAFATLPKDWKAKYQVASASLDKMLATAAAAPATTAVSATPAPAPAPGAAPDSECRRRVGSRRRRETQGRAQAPRRLREGHRRPAVHRRGHREAARGRRRQQRHRDARRREARRAERAPRADQGGCRRDLRRQLPVPGAWCRVRCGVRSAECHVQSTWHRTRHIAPSTAAPHPAPGTQH